MFLSKLLRLGSGQVHSAIYYHLVWGTKNKNPYINHEIKKSLYKYIEEIIKRKEWLLLEIGGTCDHIHILIQKTPKGEIPEVVCRIKSNSSRFMCENFVKDFSWQNGYGVFTVDSASLSRLQKYIKNQEVHHKQMSFDKELSLLLKRYNIS